MKRFWLASLAALAGLVVVGVEPALAQNALNRPAVPSYNPAFSPYLNLLRRGNSPFFNYYGLVLPELETRKAVAQLQQQTATNQQAITTLNRQQEQTASNLPETGSKPIGFMTHGKYFGGRRR